MHVAQIFSGGQVILKWSSSGLKVAPKWSSSGRQQFCTTPPNMLAGGILVG